MSLLQATLLFILALSSVNAVQASGTDDANAKFKDALENLIGDCDKNRDGEVFHENPYQKQKLPANDSELQEQSCYTHWFTQSQFSITHCDVNSDGKVTTKKTWKTDGVSKEIAKKENSCRIALENKLLEQDIAHADARIAQADARIAQGRAEVAQLDAEVAQLDAEVAQGHSELLSMLEPLSKEDLAREISKLDKRIRMTKDNKERNGLIYLRNIMIELSMKKPKVKH